MSNPDTTVDGSGTEQNEANTNSGRRTLYSFPEQGKGKWQVQDDVVMGGRSDSQLNMTDDNRAHFYGYISLENNGGFCSIHQTVPDTPYKIDETSTAFILKLKGDGKQYSFRVRTPKGRHFYGFTFPTKAGEWQTVSVPFQEMKAEFHGEPVDVPNYAGENVVEMQLLIGNNKEETFEIFLESIGVI